MNEKAVRLTVLSADWNYGTRQHMPGKDGFPEHQHLWSDGGRQTGDGRHYRLLTDCVKVVVG